jgi:hypothetical protein
MPGNESDKRGPAPTGPLPPPEKLPSSLQKIIDKADTEDNFYDELYDGTYVMRIPLFHVSYPIFPVNYLRTIF